MRQATYDIADLFRISHNWPDARSEAQWHRHIEMVFALGATTVYEVAGHRVEVAPGQVVLFSAAIPHRVTVTDRASEVYVINLPLEPFLAWSLPPGFRSALFNGEALLYEAGALADRTRLELWRQDTISADPARIMIVLLEVEALVRRLSMAELLGASPREAGEGRGGAAPRSRRAAKILEAIDHISAHLSDPQLDVAAVAAAVALNPKYLITLFRQSTGVTLVKYIRRARATVAHTLLLESARPIAEVARLAGFGSLSQFYEVIHAEFGVPPGEIRRLGQMAAPRPPVDDPYRAAFQQPSVTLPDQRQRWRFGGA